MTLTMTLSHKAVFNPEIPVLSGPKFHDCNHYLIPTKIACDSNVSAVCQDAPSGVTPLNACISNNTAVVITSVKIHVN